jgi:hypothetical protein
MNTVIVWLLVIGTAPSLPNVIPSHYYATQGDCMIVANTVKQVNENTPNGTFAYEVMKTKCVQVNVLVPK